MTKRRESVPNDCRPQRHKQSIHFLEGGPAGEILCGHAVEREPFQGKPYTLVLDDVTCWACVKKLLESNRQVRGHKPTKEFFQ